MPTTIDLSQLLEAIYIEAGAFLSSVAFLGAHQNTYINGRDILDRAFHVAHRVIHWILSALTEFTPVTEILGVWRRLEKMSWQTYRTDPLLIATAGRKGLLLAYKKTETDDIADHYMVAKHVVFITCQPACASPECRYAWLAKFFDR